MNENIEIINIDINDLPIDNIEIIEIDNYEVEIIEIEDDLEITGIPSTNIPIKQSIIDKIRKKLTNKKIAKLALSSITLIITLTGVFIITKNLEKNTWKENNNIVYNEKIENINFTLNEEEYNQIEINTEYVEKGATLLDQGIDKTEEIIIDTSNLNINKLGTYHVIYTYPININQVKTLYRTINVVDTEKPTIKLLGSNVYTMIKGEEYKEEGYIVTDNSNEELNGLVTTETNLDTTKPGKYYIKYNVQDSSGNATNITRTIIVKNNYYTNTNTILTNAFTQSGIYFTGTLQNNNFQNQILLKNKTTGDEIKVYTIKTSNHYYKVNIDTNIPNGTYELYLQNDELEPLANNMNTNNKLQRAHINNKLVTMDYSKGNVNIIIEDFEYLYDVVIDPGHGGSDYGATNGKYIEKKINLEISQYEKQRYEQMGLKVLLLRENNDTYGIEMGDETLEDVERKGYAVGYYGTVSKIVYSNHHNSSGNTSSAGWEILVPAKATYEDLKTEHIIAQNLENAYTKIVNPYYRFYTKDFETGTSNNKYNGEIYNFEDYYAVIRIPNKIYNVKNVIFEGAYINNTNDMKYYYDNGNWKKFSEIKIKAMVESIGVEYIEP